MRETLANASASAKRQVCRKYCTCKTRGYHVTTTCVCRQVTAGETSLTPSFEVWPQVALGGADDERFDGQLAWLSRDDNAFWSAQLQEVTTLAGIKINSKGNALFDTGTTQLLRHLPWCAGRDGPPRDSTPRTTGRRSGRRSRARKRRPGARSSSTRWACGTRWPTTARRGSRT